MAVCFFALLHIYYCYYYYLLMKASFLSENIVHLLPVLGKTLPSSSQIPVLSSILLEAKGGEVVFSATDLEFGISVKTHGKTEVEGGVLVPGKQIVELINAVGRGRIEVSQEKDQLVIETENGEFKFQVLPRDEFPSLFQEKGEKLSEFTQEDFAKVFEKLTFAVSQDTGRPHLTGVYMVEKDKQVDYVATDGFRLSIKRRKTETSSERLKQGLIIPPRLIQEAAVIKEEGGINLFVYEKGNQAIFETANATLVGRLIEGKYPDYDRVIPKSTITSIKLDREEFARTLKTVSVFARESANVLSLQVVNGIITMKAAASSIGDAQVKMEGIQEGEDNNISFNVKFIQDFLKVASGKNIVIKLNSSQEPAIFETDDDVDFTHVIMPVKVQE